MVAVAMVLAWGLMVLGAAPASADPIGPDCDSCYGGIYTLEYVVIDADTVQITYTMDAEGITGRSIVDAVGFKIATSVTGASLDSAPAGWGTDIEINSGVNANGCSGAGSGFVCSDYTGVGSGLPVGNPGNIYTWVFTVDYSGSLATDPGAASIKADFDQGVLSEAITLQPRQPTSEPDTLAVLGLGLVGLGLLWRKRLAKGQAG
jgi:hypothetical protein